MNRRRFLQYTIALALTAPLARRVATELPGAMLAPDHAVWVPTQAEVDEWLSYYKLWVRHGVESFADLVKGIPMTLIGEDGSFEVWITDDALVEAARPAFERLHVDRTRVAFATGDGYGCGRLGQSRFNPLFTAPSNESLAWYNGWAQGNLDYRWRCGEIKLERAPRVTCSDGRKPDSLHA